MSAYQEIGPAAPARSRVYDVAREVRTLAAQACEAATKGPRCDVRRAVQLLDQARAVLETSWLGEAAPE